MASSQWELVKTVVEAVGTFRNDPFQVFEVEHESCLDLEIFVKNGESITKGFYKDLLDIPDPYVMLRVPGSSNSSKRTSHVDNNVNPIWNETFHIYLDPKKEHTLYITLMDANHFQDEVLGVDSLDINSLVQNVPSHFTLEFPKGSKVYVTLTLQKNKTPDLRFSLSLCEEEKAFLRQRRHKVLLNMQNLMGDTAPRNKNEVPIIAVLGSGGGFRAMTCFSGAVKALHQSGILGCSTYISGLSGSSWFISTLYAHDKFPDITYDEIYEDLKESVTQNWKWNLMHSYRYLLDMMDKSRRGQPVSFTDVFGHLLGDVLLKGKKGKKLSDQRKIVAEGRVPLPLYTCLHAKASVSCRAFSEWIEFSPYEIGIAKYGTFMKTEYFGSKFIVGKLIKQFPEFPLHYLQGVWGSAFTILMKRLAFDGGSKQDLVQMMREVNEERAIHEMLEKENLRPSDNDSPTEKESDTDDEADVEGADDKLSEEEDDNGKNRSLEDDIATINKMLGNTNLHQHPLQSIGDQTLKEETVDATDDNPTNIIKESCREEAKPVERKISNDKKIMKGFSFDFVRKTNFAKKNSNGLQRKQSEDEAVYRKISTQSDPGITGLVQQTNTAVRNERLKRTGAIKGDKSNNLSTKSQPSSNYWRDKRNMRKSQKERKPTMIQNWMKNSGVLNSRAGRAGEILNPFRGLSLRNSFPLSPFAASVDDEDEDDSDITDAMDIGLGCRYKPLDNNAKKLFIVDSGLAFNSPFPLLLRPQRAVDIYLSFDFSQRPSDRHMPFKELLLAEKWAQQNQVPFPPVEKLAREFSKDTEVKELYVFKDENDPFCPVILHFTIVNNRFKWNKAPGVPRETSEEIDFANFSLFDDPSQPYASTNFVYDPLKYERLCKLVEYNTLINIDNIKKEIAEMVEKKREMAIQSVERTFNKMQRVIKACRRFQRSGNLSLRVNEAQRKQFILACKAADVAVAKSVSPNMDDADEESPAYYDAQTTFDDWDNANNTECEDEVNANSTECEDEVNATEEESNKNDNEEEHLIPVENQTNHEDLTSATSEVLDQDKKKPILKMVQTLTTVL